MTGQDAASHRRAAQRRTRFRPTATFLSSDTDTEYNYPLNSVQQPSPTMLLLPCRAGRGEAALAPSAQQPLRSLSSLTVVVVAPDALGRS